MTATCSRPEVAAACAPAPCTRISNRVVLPDCGRPRIPTRSIQGPRVRFTTPPPDRGRAGLECTFTIVRHGRARPSATGGLLQPGAGIREALRIPDLEPLPRGHEPGSDRVPRGGQPQVDID